MEIYDVSSYRSDRDWLITTHQHSINSSLWGFLTCSNGSRVASFSREIREHTFGSSVYNNTVVKGTFIGDHHCTIVWDGQETIDSVVSVRVSSHMSADTWINETHISGDLDTSVCHGDMIHFGTLDGEHTYLYHHSAHLKVAKPLEGVYNVDGPVVGNGSFGVVRRVCSRNSGEYKAAKRINLASVNDESYELSIMLLLNSRKHKNICNIEDFFIQTGPKVIDIVMPLLKKNLAKYLHERHEEAKTNPACAISEKEAKSTTFQICDAMKHVHSDDLIHYDLKPENILVSSESPLTVKVADFGIATMIVSTERYPTPCGTIGYMAPEIVQCQPHTNLADSWGVGVMIFQLLTNNVTPEFSDKWELNSAPLDELVTKGIITEQAREFTQNLLKADWETERSSLTEALEHSWLRDTVENIASDVSVKSFEQTLDLGRSQENVNSAAHSGIHLQLVTMSEGVDEDMTDDVVVWSTRTPSPALSLNDTHLTSYFCASWKCTSTWDHYYASNPDAPCPLDPRSPSPTQSLNDEPQEVVDTVVSRPTPALVTFESQRPGSRTFTTNLSNLRTPSPSGSLSDIHLEAADQQPWQSSLDPCTLQCPPSLGTLESSALLARTDWSTSGYTSALAMLASQAAKCSRGVYPGHNGSRLNRTIRKARESAMPYYRP